MIDRFENIADLHEEVFQFLMTNYNPTQNPFNPLFILRSGDNQENYDALQQGYWFKGNESYVNLYFTTNANHRTFFKNNFQITINKYGDLQVNFYFEHNFDAKLEDDIIAKFQKIGIPKTHRKNNFHRKFSIIPDENNADYRLQLGNIIHIIQEFLESTTFQEQNVLIKIPLADFKNDLNVIENIRQNNKIQSVYVNKLVVNNYHSVQNTAIQEIPNDTKWLFLTGENGAGKTLILQSIAIGFWRC